MKSKKNLYKVLSSSVIATMLTVSFGTGIGHAEESSSQPEVQTAIAQDSTATTNTAEATTDTTTAQTIEPTVDRAVTDQAAVSESAESSLLPGDLFYFFKTLTEKIKLALANKDIEKAMLLVQYTQERLNEADALFKNGEEDLANETIQKALELQGLALDYSDDGIVKDDSDETTTDAVSENTSADSVQGEEVDSETTTEDSTTVETEEQENTTVEQEESVTSQDEASVSEEDSESTELEDVKAQLEEAFANNVHGLLIAIQNVKNPKALKVLTRNLEKQAKKYEKRYGKLLKAEDRYTKVVSEIEEKVESGEISKEEADQKIANVEQELVKKQQEVKAEVQKDSAKESTVVKEEVKTVQNEDENKDDDQDVDKDENKESKYEQKQYKEELKQERKMQREELKAKKQQVKEERKQEHEKEKHEKKDKDRE